MNRSAKRHRSTKVPNVKLRPAPVGTSASHDRRRQEAEAEREDLAHYRRLRENQRAGKKRATESDEEGDDDDDDNHANDDDRGPLLGCVICMTGIVEEKVKLTEFVHLLGGVTQGNLTEDATHLVASESGSQKHSFALKLGLPIMKPEWIKELRARYTEAIDYDFDGLMQEFRLDTFENVVAALAGITEASERTEIRKKLKSGSASTPTTFTLDGSFTHLVCGDIKTSQTMDAVIKYRRKAQRFMRRGETLPDDQEPLAREMKAAVRLRVVWKEWVDDCLEVQGSIDDDIYSVEQSRPTLAQRKMLIDSILEERENRAQLNRKAMMAARQESTETVAKRKGASTQVKETPSTGYTEVQRVVKKPKIDIGQYVQQISRGEMGPPPTRCQTVLPDKESKKISGLEKARSYMDHSEGLPTSKHLTPSTKQNSIITEEERRTEETNIKDKGEGEEEEEEEEEEMQLEEDPAAGLRSDIREKSLSSLYFRLDLRDDDRNRAARKALEGQGVFNVLEAEDSGKAHFHILPLGKVHVPINNSSHLGVAVTHLFIERCLFESRVVNLNESFALQPAVVSFPLSGAEDVHVGLTGFAAEDDVDRKQVEMALQAAGIDTTSTLKKGHHTHLLIGKEAKESKSSRVKIQRAKEWGIHCVGLEFVDTIYQRGIIEPIVSKLAIARGQQSGTRAMSRGTSMGASIQEIGSQASLQPQQANSRALSVIQQASHSRPWQRSASGSQALLDGEESRGLFNKSSLTLHHNVDSLEAGSLAIKTSAEEVMALLSNRQLGDTSHDSDLSSTSTVLRKRNRLPPSRLRKSRATSTIGQDQLADENPSAEELLAIRKEEELLVGNIGYTQTNFNQQENESMRVIYDDPMSRRELRKLGDLIATSVKNKAQQDEAASTRNSSTEADDEPVFTRTTSTPNSVSPSKHLYKNTSFSPSIKARRQPGTCNRD